MAAEEFLTADYADFADFLGRIKASRLKPYAAPPKRFPPGVSKASCLESYAQTPKRRDVSAPPLCVLASTRFKASVLLQKGERYVAGRPIALLGDDQLRQTGLFVFCFIIGLVVLRSDEKADQVGVLFDGARLSQIT